MSVLVESIEVARVNVVVLYQKEICWASTLYVIMIHMIEWTQQSALISNNYREVLHSLRTSLLIKSAKAAPEYFIILRSFSTFSRYSRISYVSLCWMMIDMIRHKQSPVWTGMLWPPSSPWASPSWRYCLDALIAHNTRNHIDRI